MKKGINYWSFADGTPLRKAAELAKDAGFQGIEYCMAETGELGLDATESDIRSVKTMTESVGLEIASLASWVPWEHSLTSDDPKHRQIARDVVKRLIEAGAILGVDTVLVVPGYVGVDFVAGSEICRYDEVYDRALEAIGYLEPFARSHGVAMGIENVWNKFLLSPLEFRSFIDSFASPFVGAYFDVGNVVLTGYPEQWIHILGKRIKKVHFKDYRRNPGGFGAFVDLLAGDVDYPAVMAAFREVGYDGYCNAEMMPPYKHFSEQIIYNTSATMSTIFGSIGKEE
ncbi:MAG: xylulose 5-phosphate 3-epimerase [Spirochaetae bacterium HGW-Spirochaetae-2]|jgi:hexulose-6-phosphate isomerase|nr:MAG: xylulose 5-phosphate 3-epimerase [Spirochaetae bacterium HGW-Spirochaetae-2]